MPVEWDDLRDQLEGLPNAAAHPAGRRQHLGLIHQHRRRQLRGQGADIRDTIIKLSQAFSALGDHSGDIFKHLKNLSILVSALHDSTDLLRQLNQNLAAVTGFWPTTRPGRPMQCATSTTVVGDVASFVAENREALGTTSDKLASVTTALVESLDDIKQALHIAPDGASELREHLPARECYTYRRAGGQQLRQPDWVHLRGGTGGLPIGRRATSKLCVQYLAPIVKNRQYNLPPLGFDPLRRSAGPAQRGHLQRGLDAAGLCSAAPHRRRARQPPPAPGPPRPGRAAPAGSAPRSTADGGRRSHRSRPPACPA